MLLLSCSPTLYVLRAVFFFFDPQDNSQRQADTNEVGNEIVLRRFLVKDSAN
jgi:hypothetical protein